MRRVVIAALLALTAHADAQASGVVVRPCAPTDDAPILEALRLELGDRLGAFETPGSSLSIVVPCEGDAMVTLTDERSGVVLSRVVPLADLPEALHARMLALVAGELERLARRAQGSRLAQSEPEMLRAAPSAEPTEVAVPTEGPAPAELTAPTEIPTPPEADGAPPCADADGRPCAALPHRATRFVAEASVRVLALAPLVLGGTQLGIEHDRFTGGIAVLAARRSVSAGVFGVLVTSLEGGVRVFPQREHSTFALVLHGELGLVRTHGKSTTYPEMRGAVGVAPVVAGSAQALMRLTAREAPIGFRLAVEVGYASGPDVTDATGVTVLELAGPFVGMTLGVAL